MRRSTHLWLALCAGIAVLATGCGGGSGGDAPSTGSTTPPPATATAAQITGTAATGAALANAPVTITNASGASPCTEASITTSALGSYTCTLKDGEKAPFFVVVTDPTGIHAPLVSVSTTTPAAGGTLTVNATPLTTAIVAQLAADGNALSVVSARSVDAAALKAVTDNVVAQLAPVLAGISAPAGFDPFTTSITAATANNTGNTADMVLDVVKVVTDPATGKAALSTIDSPTPVVLATASSSGSSLATPTASVSTLSQATQIAAKKFNDCFALTTAQRVLHTTSRPANQGGDEVDNVGAACLDFVADSTNAAGIDYVHNGYDAGQHFFGLLTADSMTGAKFSVPEIMAFYPKNAAATPGAPDAFDRAVVNIKFVDANGDPGSVITVAARIPGSSSTARPTEWWLVGNQQSVDIAVRLNIRRVEQKNAATTTGKFSTFQTGIQFNINSQGPGSVVGGNAVSKARVKGPGLPANGLVYVVSTGAQSSMDLFNNTGDLVTGSACGNAGATVNCPNVWFARTRGISGTDAATLATNPTNGGNTLIWAQPGAGYDTSRIVKGAKYQVELFYGSGITNASTPAVTLTKTLLTDLVQATQAVNLQWNTPGTQTLAALDPAGSLAGQQTALVVDWVQNPSAEQIGSAQAVINATSGSFGPNKNAPRGATSVVLNNQVVPAFTTTTTRTILLAHRMLDGSSKTAVYTYN